MTFVSQLNPSRTDVQTTIRAKVDGPFEDDVLWFEFPDSLSYSIEHDLMDHWLVALLVPTMERGERLHIEGAVSRMLLQSINDRIVPLLHRFNERWHEIRVSAAKEVDSTSVDANRGVVTGFSGGVDGLVTLGNFGQTLSPKTDTITHLIFNNVGQFGSDFKWFEADFHVARRCASKFGYKLLKIGSNLNGFYVSDFLSTATLRNLSVGFALQKGVKSMLVSSGDCLPIFHERDASVSISNGEMASIDQVLLPMFSTKQFLAKSVGGEYSRSAKTKLISEMSIATDTLFVCIRGNTINRKINCSICSKCSRTMFMLYLHDCLEDYSEVFDLEFGKPKWALCARVMGTASDLTLRDLMSMSELKKVPRWWIWLGLFLRTVWKFSPAALRWRLRTRLPLWFPY